MTRAPQLNDPPAPSDISTNELFVEALAAIPSAAPSANPSEFTEVVRPFQAQSFARGIDPSHADIAPMAILPRDDGSVLVSGGLTRGDLYELLQYTPGQQWNFPCP